VADREDIGSWLGGGPTGSDGPGVGRGARLGLPESGPGSLAPVGRRAIALVIDWMACLLISGAFFAVDPDAFLLSRGNSMATLGIFALENVLLVGSIGNTLGHRLLGLRVRRVFPAKDGGNNDPVWATAAPGFLSALVRTILLCLVVPAAVWDADGRGLHDRVAGTAIVRR
jgi:uncharacterized RDD family membrane protein YckC